MTFIITINGQAVKVMDEFEHEYVHHNVGGEVGKLVHIFKVDGFVCFESPLRLEDRQIAASEADVYRWPEAPNTPAYYGPRRLPAVAFPPGCTRTGHTRVAFDTAAAALTLLADMHNGVPNVMHLLVDQYLIADKGCSRLTSDVPAVLASYFVLAHWWGDLSWHEVESAMWRAFIAEEDTA